MKRLSGRHPRLLLFLPALCLLLLWPVAADAATVSKPYSATVSVPPAAPPGSAAAGAHVTFNAVLQNLDTQQTLGSANITPPDGFAVARLSTTRGQLTVGPNGVIQLRNLGLVPSTPPSTVTVTIEADVPCSGTSHATWGVQAKQSNDFNGTGNDFTLVSKLALRQTTVLGTCHLQFVNQRQPTDARAKQTITSSPFNPTGPFVQVEAVDGANRRLTNYANTVTLRLNAGSTGDGVLTGQTASALAGVATFTTLQLSAIGRYALDASAPDLTGATSVFFHIAEAAAICQPGAACSTSVRGGDPGPTNVAVTSPGVAGEGVPTFLTASSGVQPVICTDDLGRKLTLTPDDDPAFFFVVDLNSKLRAKTATITIDKFWVNLNANNGAAFLPVCYGAPASFTTASGEPAPRYPLDYDFNGDGVPEQQFVGLLPDCSALPAGSPAQACVTKRFKQAANGVIVVSLPASNIDPKMHG